MKVSNPFLLTNSLPVTLKGNIDHGPHASPDLARDFLSRSSLDRSYLDPLWRVRLGRGRVIWSGYPPPPTPTPTPLYPLPRTTYKWSVINTFVLRIFYTMSVLELVPQFSSFHYHQKSTSWLYN